VEERVGRGRTERAGAARRKNARVAADQDAQRGAAVCDGQIVIGEVMLLSLRFDHRIVDGHVGAAFADEIINLLQDPDALLLNI
jgi:pyruvate/2-oxoglutarate dehydrogenase complex dihydrolipoamide acyltransferase (E2) component